MESTRLPAPQMRRSRARGLGAAAAAGSVIALVLIAAPSPAEASGLLLTGTASASSQEGPFAPANVLDFNRSTRWSSAARDNQWLQIDLGSVSRISAVTLDWEAAYARTYKIQVSEDGVRFRDATPILGGAVGSQTRTLELFGRYVRVLGLTRATNWGFSLRDVVLATYLNPLPRCDDFAAADGRPALASSVEGAATPASAAFDSSPSTRWSSGFTDEQWIQVDLGRVQEVCRVWLDWEAAFARTFTVQGSVDGATFTDISAPLQGYEGLQSVPVRGFWRYVRIAGLSRATSYGYSLYDVGVVGSTGDRPTPPPTPTDS